MEPPASPIRKPLQVDKSEDIPMRTTAIEEISAIVRAAAPIIIANVSEWIPASVSQIFVGHLPNAAVLLSGTGLAKTYSNVTGLSIAWGMTSALHTLIPQALGAGKRELLGVYMQRAFVMIAVLFIPLTILQFYAGDIMRAIGQPSDLCDIVALYARLLIPNIIFQPILTVLQRLCQSLNYNNALLIIQFSTGVLSIPLNYVLIYTLDLGYAGAALATCACFFLAALLTFLYLIYRGYGFIFRPLSFSVVCDWNGLKEYILLSVPGLFQQSFEWWVLEILIVFSGYIHNPDIAISAASTLNVLTAMLFMVWFGTSIALTIRVGKFIGAGMVASAQQSAICGMIVGYTIVSLVVVALYFLRIQIPLLVTNDMNVVHLCTTLIYVAMTVSFAVQSLQNFGGIYRALGLQHLAARAVLISYYAITLPLTAILLFRFKYKNYLTLGSIIIYGGFALGNGLGAVMLGVHLSLFVDWNHAAEQSQKRIRRTMKAFRDYGSLSEKSSEDSSESRTFKPV